MTSFNKTVTRRTEQTVVRNRRLVISLEPGDIISVREERARDKYNVTAKALYDLAVKTGAKQ